MKPDIRSKLYRAASALELAVGVIVLLACIVCGAGIVITTDLQSLLQTPMYFQAQLSDICYIIIGIEFIKMIASHTIDSVVDVMLLAVARQMIVEHTMPLENLLAVCAIAVLFVIRKYLYISRIDRAPDRKKDPEPVEDPHTKEPEMHMPAYQEARHK